VTAGPSDAHAGAVVSQPRSAPRRHEPSRGGAANAANAQRIADREKRDVAPSLEGAAADAAPAGAGGGGGGAGAAGGGDGVAGVSGVRAGGGDGAGDLRPWCSACPVPVYPARARREGWQGTVDVDLDVGGDGAVEHASVGRSSGFAVLDAAAVTVARCSRFRVAAGAERRGQLRYRFVLEGSTDRPL